MSEKFTVEKIKAARAGQGECDMSVIQGKCPRCRFRKNAPEMVDFLLAELDARSFPSEGDKRRVEALIAAAEIALTSLETLAQIDADNSGIDVETCEYKGTKELRVALAAIKADTERLGGTQ